MALSRREMLVKSATGCASFAAAGLMVNCGFDVQPAEEISALANNAGQVSIALSQTSQLAAVGGAVILRIAAPSSVAVPDGGVLLVRHGDAEFVAVTAVCTHAGCLLSYSKGDRQIACPCHGSRFHASVDASGNCIGAVARGPAASPIQAFDVDFDAKADLIVVNLTSPAFCPGVFVPEVVNGQVVLPFDSVPELKNPGGAKLFMSIKGSTEPLVVVRIDQSTVIALNARCTHQGCSVAYQSSTKDLLCPCHLSRYDLSGKVTSPVISGQANLEKYTATMDAQAITVTVN